jgi:hypothetical protein
MISARTISAALAVSLAGCATPLPGDPARLSADQLAALARDRSATVGCSTAQATLTGSVTTIYINIDAASALGGVVEVGADCGVRIRTGIR